ncbi:MAG: protein kinase [Candidatus Berkiella sp.]
MTTSGPSDLTKGSKVDLGNDGTYTIRQQLGKGVEGTTFRAAVEKPRRGSVGAGSQVALKVQIPAEDDEKAQARERELRVLEREGTVLAKKLPTAKDQDQRSFMVMPVYPGTTLLNALYEVTDRGIGNKKPLSQEEKEGIAVSLLQDMFAMQQLGIVHGDLKPDNILAHIESRTAKIIDMGESFIAAEGNPHPTFVGPGPLYEAVETREPNGHRIHLNSFKTDTYAIGMILASMFTDAHYQNDARTNGANQSLAARQAMNDVLGDGVQHKQGMPDGLLQVVRSLATIDPNARPANIALADGIANCPQLKAIHEAGQAIAQFKKTELFTDVEKFTNKKNISNELQAEVRKAFIKNNDLPSLRIELAKLSEKYPNEKEGIKQMSAMGDKIDKFCETQARQLQAIRADQIVQSQHLGVVKEIAGILDGRAQGHKKNGGALTAAAPLNASQFDDIGKLLFVASRTLAASHSPVDPQQIDQVLSQLKQAIENLPNDKFGKTNPEANQAAKDQLLKNISTTQEMYGNFKTENLQARAENESPKAGRRATH